MVSSLIGNVLVPYDYSPTGPPIDRGQSNTVYDPYVQDVYRSPTVNAYENEPGARWTGRPIKRFTENGYVLGQPAAPTTIPPLTVRMTTVAAIGPSIAMALGAGFGAALAPSEHRVMGTVLGALAGGILGVIFGPAV